MNQSKYFFQGFLFVFGLAPVPFADEVNSKNKISNYWDSISSVIQKVFHGQTSK